MRSVANNAIRKNAETKFHLTQFNTPLDTTTPFLGLWTTGLALGTGAGNRIGTKIETKHQYLNIKILFNQVTTGTPFVNIRCMVFYPRKGVSTQNVLTGMSATNPGLFSRFDPTRVITLHDEFYRLNSAASGAGGTIQPSGSDPSFYNFKFSLNKPFIYNYDNTSNIVTRDPIVYITTDKTAADTSVLLVVGYLSMSFKDS